MTIVLKNHIIKLKKKMALSDCIECWCTPCECGYEYRNWNKRRKDELVKAVQGYNTEDLLRWIQTSAPYDTMMTMGPEEIVELFLNQNKDK